MFNKDRFIFYFLLGAIIIIGFGFYVVNIALSPRIGFGEKEGVVCKSDGDCLGNQQCFDGGCKNECAKDEDCDVANEFCSETGLCLDENVYCQEGLGRCPLGKDVCKIGDLKPIGKCVECGGIGGDNSNCELKQQVCDSGTNSCVGCKTNNDCQGSYGEDSCCLGIGGKIGSKCVEKRFCNSNGGVGKL